MPPDKGGGAPTPGSADHHQHQTTRGGISVFTARRPDLGQLHRRRAASRRLAPLICGCRDPWPCRCNQPPLTEHALDNWRAAAEHVLAAGWMPLVPLEVAQLLHRGCDGEVA